MDYNFSEEIRSGFKVTEERKKIWACELELLQRLLDVCKRHGLRCWVDSGTLLGAVRHKGFIPWDDDIDVVMMRDDYDRLMKIGPEEFHHPFFFQSAYTDINYFRGHVQIRNSETTAILPDEYNREFNQGIFIDVFPLDGLPDSDQEYEELKRKSEWMKVIMTRYHHFETLGLRVIRNTYRYCQANAEVDKVGFQEYYRTYEDLFRRVSVGDAKKVTKLSSVKTRYKGIDKHYFDQTVWMDFENIKVPVPSCYDAYLRLMYGDDYMTPIQASTAHGAVCFDTDQSYKAYLREHHSMFVKQALAKKLRKLWPQT